MCHLFKQSMLLTTRKELTFHYCCR